MADIAGKMAFLQRQSDETRVQFLQTEMDTCFTMAGIAEAELRNGLKDAYRRSRGHAEQGYGTPAAIPLGSEARRSAIRRAKQFGKGCSACAKGSTG